MLKLQKKLHAAGKTIAFVPTMGALHQGHISLIDRAKKQSDYVIASIFVNPLQFDQKKDFKKYPRTIKQDLKLLNEHFTDCLFLPEYTELYPSISINIDTGPIGRLYCGTFRPGHFEGVLRIVLKLFNIIQAQKAFFGEKDAQQLFLIRKLVGEMNMDVKIISCPTKREKSGLAMSSRNQHLNVIEKQHASQIYKTLCKAKGYLKYNVMSVSQLTQWIKSSLKKIPNSKLEYVNIIEEKTFLPAKYVKGHLRILTAIWISKTRLIDNISIRIK